MPLTRHEGDLWCVPWASGEKEGAAWALWADRAFRPEVSQVTSLDLLRSCPLPTETHTDTCQV